MSIDPAQVRYVATPATTAFMRLLDSGARQEALAVLDEHWGEIWYAIDPTDLKALLGTIPDPSATLGDAAYLQELVGSGTGAGVQEPAPDARPEQRLNVIAQQIADLRLAGKPAAAMERAWAIADDVRRLRGPVVDTTEGGVGMWLVQAGITAFLAGDLTGARTLLREVVGLHRPARFPFVEREAAAKLALVHAVAGEPQEAEVWLARADQAPRTASWVEKLIDDSIWLARYICAVDALDLELAERMRRASPSPFAQLEFWGPALQAQVRHLCLTGRHDQARGLCDEMAAAGLPPPEADGWLSRMLNDAYLMCSPLGEATADRTPRSDAVALLASRVRSLTTGQFAQVTLRDVVEHAADLPTRTRLGLTLLRGQGLLYGGRQDDGRLVIQAALAEAFERGTLGVLSLLTDESLDQLSGTELGMRARHLVDDRGIFRIKIVNVLSSPLSEAETRVLRLLAQGMSRPQIAQASYVSVDTVKSQLSSAYRKLGVRNRAEAITKLEQLQG